MDSKKPVVVWTESPQRGFSLGVIACIVLIVGLAIATGGTDAGKTWAWLFSPFLLLSVLSLAIGPASCRVYADRVEVSERLRRTRVVLRGGVTFVPVSMDRTLYQLYARRDEDMPLMRRGPLAHDVRIPEGYDGSAESLGLLMNEWVAADDPEKVLLRVSPNNP